jgi:hypothetical protein
MAAALKRVILIILTTMGNENIYHDLGTAKEGDKKAAGLLVDKKIGNLANEGPRISCVQGTGNLAYEELDDGTHQYTCSPPPPHTGGNKRRRKSKKTKKRKTMKKKKLTKKRKTMKKKK